MDDRDGWRETVRERHDDDDDDEEEEDIVNLLTNARLLMNIYLNQNTAIYIFLSICLR